MNLYRVILPLLVVASFVGCVKADRGQRYDQSNLQKHALDRSLIDYNNTAQFEVGDIQLEDIKFSDMNEGAWKMVDQIQIFMKLCGIRDRASQGTIRNEKFHIKSELGSNIMWAKDGERADETNRRSHVYNPITVNSGNCLRWTQVVPVFDYLAPSVNIALHFEIQSLSGNLGKVVKRIGFNPWDMYRNKSQTKGFMDLTDFDRSQWYTGRWATGPDVISALKGELFDSEAELRFQNLTVEPVERERQRIAEYNARLNNLSAEEKATRQKIDRMLMKRNDGVHINLNMTGKPVMWVKDSTGVPHPEPIDTGRFLVYMNLIASGAADNSEKHLLSSNIAQITRNNTTFEWKMNADKMLAASVPLLLEKRTELGSVELLVRIVPRSQEHRQLKPFSAVFRLGQYDDWIRRQTVNYQFNELFESMDQVDYDKYLDSVVGIEDIDKRIMTIRDMRRFYFSPLKMRFVRIMPGESATDRTLQYSVTTCIENWRGRSVGRGLQFNVVTEDDNRERTMRRETNEDGCLTWFGTLSHKYYRREVLEAKDATVTYVGTMNNGNSSTLIEGQNLTDKERAQSVSNNIDQSTQKDANGQDQIVNNYQEKFTYYMNPWDEKWTFGWDGPDMPANYYNDIIEQRKNAPKSQLFIADFRYETMGFRYAIDKYLNLKVKKAVLFKAYPYVLKYNSIVRGRLGTEKLRDGVYLMKVALQKDYLDPSANGVRIYDEKLNEPFRIANELAEKNFEGYITKTGEGDSEEALENLPKTSYEKSLIENGDPNAAISAAANGASHSGVSARMAWSEDPSERGTRVTHDLLSKTDLKESKKHYISVQTKLIRVLGGMIITPIEFEVDDLRLMRIRNQFFIQLETIDEHKLRIATAIDKSINKMFLDSEGEIKGQELESRYNEIFTEIESLYGLHEESAEIKSILDQYTDIKQRETAEQQLVEIEGSITSAKKKLYQILGLDRYKSGSKEFERHRMAIEERLKRLDTYRKLKDERGLPYLTEYRNDKRELINRVLGRFSSERKYQIEKNVSDASPENLEQIEESDPYMKFLFMGTQYDGKNGRVSDLIENEFNVDIEELKFADFTSSPLTPSFDFSLLSNQGVHEPGNAEDDGKSGLPLRTFVGPLTFVFNTNGSSLRPTNILNEHYCRTAYCEEPEQILLQNDPNSVEGKINLGIPPGNVEVATEVGEDFQLSMADQPMYASGDSVNSNYENNKYYGYLKKYHGVDVDDLIDAKKEIDEKNIRKMETASQVINFVKTMGLKYTLLNDNQRSRLKGIDYPCTQDVKISRLDSCFSDITNGPDVLPVDAFYAQLNDREAANPHLKDLESGSHFYNNTNYYYAVGREPISEQDLTKVMTHGWKSSKVDPALSRKLMHRMCFALAQDFFKEKYFQKDIVLKERLKKAWNKATMNSRSLLGLEQACHRFVGQMYGYYKDQDYEKSWEPGIVSDASLKPREVSFSPIVLERKVRTYRTTDRYVYRGGKSLNINLTTSFNLSSSNGIKISTGASYKPWEHVSGLIDNTLGRIPILGRVISNIVGSFTLTRANSRDESAGRTQGTNVSSGTFLVSQQATFDIELGEYERCMVARFHPAFVKDFITESKSFLKNEFVAQDIDENNDGVVEEYSDINKQGIMICTGRPVSDETLPVNEKYYYFTQHFTEGDMLDTADLHNHPWLLQLRGYRDFQVFTSMIGAREVGYIDNNRWVKDVMSRTFSDAASFELQGSHEDNLSPELEIVNKASDINWPLDELGRTYFEVLPTFPGLYTYMNETGENVAEWPYDTNDPGRSFEPTK